MLGPVVQYLQFCRKQINCQIIEFKLTDDWTVNIIIFYFENVTSFLDGWTVVAKEDRFGFICRTILFH